MTENEVENELLKKDIEHIKGQLSDAKEERADLRETLKTIAESLPTMRNDIDNTVNMVMGIKGELRENRKETEINTRFREDFKAIDRFIKWLIAVTGVNLIGLSAMILVYINSL
jgi:DNA-binding transcriptional regulator GbsR (MarR family)